MTNDPETLTDASGAYLLLIELKRAIELPRRFVGQSLTEGYYAYAGSAYGPGGIRARCRRHLQRPATQRWHIDWLTRSADDVQAVAFPGGTECRLMETLVECAKARIPILGFGSSDCRQCQAHLVAFDGRDCWDDVIRAQLADIVGIRG
ncbi:MAG: GIY-YIG nuclease family protein [Geminicoccaceae bacterium]